MSTSLRILCVGLEGKSRESANAFIFPIVRKLKHAKLVDTMHDAAVEIMQKKCPYDCVLLPDFLPNTFEQNSGPLRIPIKEGILTSGEAIGLAVLQSNPQTRCIIMASSRKLPTALFCYPDDLAKGRLHIAFDGTSWRDAFIESEMFNQFVDHLELTQTA